MPPPPLRSPPAPPAAAVAVAQHPHPLVRELVPAAAAAAIATGTSAKHTTLPSLTIATANDGSVLPLCSICGGRRLLSELRRHQQRPPTSRAGRTAANAAAPDVYVFRCPQSGCAGYAECTSCAATSGSRLSVAGVSRHPHPLRTRGAVPAEVTCTGCLRTDLARCFSCAECGYL
ncbi:hypothetical protein HK405_014822, partial [Cladochytrium tenue]